MLELEDRRAPGDGVLSLMLGVSVGLDFMLFGDEMEVATSG